MLFRSWMNDQARALQFHGLLRMSLNILTGIAMVQAGYSLSSTSSFELMLFYAAAFSFFLNHAISKTLLSHHRSENERSIIIMALVGSLLSALIAGSMVALTQSISYIIVGLLALTAPLGNSLEYFLLLRERIKTIYIYAACLWLVQIGILGALVWYSVPVEYIAWSFIALNMVRGTLALLHSRIQFNHIQIDFYQLRIFSGFAGIALIGGCMNYIDGFVIEWMIDDFQFSLYRYGARELPFLNLIYTSLASSFVLIIKNDPKGWHEKMKKRLSQMMNWSFPLIIVLLFLSPHLFKVLFSEEYQLSALFFNIYLMLLLFRTWIGQSVLIAHHKTRKLLVLSISEMSLNIIFSIVLGALFGIEGILWATVIAYAVHKGLLILHLTRIENIRMNEIMPIRKYSIFSVIIVFGFIISYHLNF